MNTTALITTLQELPARTASQREKLLDAESDLLTAKADLQRVEDALLLLPKEATPINGANAEVRAAQMRQHTQEARQGVSAAEGCVTHHRARLLALQDEFSALRSVARLLASGGDE